MGYTFGQLTYHYAVEIDLENLVDRIASKIGHMDDDYCWDVDGDKLIITAKHTTGYKHWYSRATLESPGEDEIEPNHRVDDEVNIEKVVLEALHETEKIKAEIKVDDDYDFDEDDRSW